MLSHLINTDLGNRGMGKIYPEYRLRNGDFVKKASQDLFENLEHVLIVTGFPVPPLNIPENDGPSGALAIFHAVKKLGGCAEILTYPLVREFLTSQGTRVIPAEEYAEIPLEDYSSIIAVELPGRSRDGKYYSMRGLEIETLPLDSLFMKAKKTHILTIGVGDGGNEVGMGKIPALIEKYVPLGNKIVSTVATEHLIISAVSNWGAYALVAMLSILAGENFLRWDEEEIIREMKECGLIDGVLLHPSFSVDGIPAKIHSAMVTLMSQIVEHSLQGQIL